MEKIPERLSALIAALKLTRAEFASAIAISQASLGRYLAGEAAPSFPVLHKLAEVYPGVNTRWLLTGVGEMFAEGGATDVITREHYDALRNELAAQRKLVQAYELVLDQRGLLTPEPMRRAS